LILASLSGAVKEHIARLRYNGTSVREPDPDPGEPVPDWLRQLPINPALGPLSGKLVEESFAREVERDFGTLDSVTSAGCKWRWFGNQVYVEPSEKLSSRLIRQQSALSTAAGLFFALALFLLWVWLMMETSSDHDNYGDPPPTTPWGYLPPGSDAPIA
jgi:hypothetical protein